MESIFENKFVRSEEMIREFQKHYFFRRPLMIVIDVILAINLILNIGDLAFNSNINLFLLFLVVFWFSYKIFTYNRSTKIMIARDKESNGGKPIEIFVTVTEDGIITESSTGSKNELPYENIKTVLDTTTCIHLLSKANLVYTLKKDNFTKGTCGEFKAFLKAQGVTIKEKFFHKKRIVSMDSCSIVCS